ncbi:hypothetical protein RJ640_008666 [Escallonia rubra]|uniref:Fe2OG dioxygenase domain-containing protein n=1 Tax=Escallonia rubra TaxID=112253 RepID=A0AA88UJZ1_9ASTE|nr:hypothetical protein RJ640_008666 [Escallonia rubra]
MLFESYDIQKYYDSHIESTTYLLRLLKHRGPKANEDNVAIPPHTDKSFFTILHQNEVDGLHVKTKDGQWIAVEFPPSSFVVMAGDACMGWTNDRVCSPHHRVIMTGEQTRYSMALFSFVSKLIQAPEELVDDEHPLRYKPFDQVELLKYYHTEEGHQAENTVKAFCGI